MFYEIYVKCEHNEERLKIYNFLMHSIVTIKSLRCDVIFSFILFYFHTIFFGLNEDFILSQWDSFSHFYAQHVGRVSHRVYTICVALEVH